MLRIVRVDTLDDSTLDIELNIGHLILFSMKHLLDSDPDYAFLQGKVPFPCPINTGFGISWQNGPALRLDNILALLAVHNGESEAIR